LQPWRSPHLKNERKGFGGGVIFSSGALTTFAAAPGDVALAAETITSPVNIAVAIASGSKSTCVSIESRASTTLLRPLF
jgi:hypothetical protein